MATVGKMIAELVARTGPFEKGLNKAQKKTRKFTDSLGKMAAGIAAIGAAAATAALTGLALLVRHQLGVIDALGKTSDKLGIAVEDLQALQLAAGKTGVESKQLELGLQRMTRRIAEAAQGAGEAQGALEELGLDAVALSRAGVAEQFRRISDAFEQVESSADRVRLGFKLFDSEGVALINTLALGRAGLDETRELMDEMGLSLSRLDASKVEQANDAWLEFKTILNGVVQRLTVEFAPILTVVVEKLIMMGREGKTAGDLIKQSMEGLAKTLGKIAEIIGDIEFAILKVQQVRLKGKSLGFGDPLGFLPGRKGKTQSRELLADVEERLSKNLRKNLGDDIIRAIEQVKNAVEQPTSLAFN
jgi:hypothetical protein